MRTSDKLIAISVIGMAVWMQGCFRCESEQVEDSSMASVSGAKSVELSPGGFVSAQINPQGSIPGSQLAKNGAKEGTTRVQEPKSKFVTQPIVIVPGRVYQLRSSLLQPPQEVSSATSGKTEPPNIPIIAPLTKEEADERGRFEAQNKKAR